MPDRGDEQQTHTERVAAWLQRHDGLELPRTDRRSDRYRVVLAAALAYIGPCEHDRRRDLAMGVVCDYLADVTAETVGREARRHLARLVGEYDPLAVLDAAGETTAWGAGLAEGYAEDPLAATKYMTAVINGHGAKAGTS